MKLTAFTIFMVIILIKVSFSFQLQKADTIVIASWNLENLFDTTDDPGKNDFEFTPEGRKQWTQERLDKKLYNLSRVIRIMNADRGPDILGVVEVEHESLLDSMINKYLSDKDYKVAYAESPDRRGIDNGLIYRKGKFKLLDVKTDTIHLPDNYPTRLILNVNLLDSKGDTLIFFVNHWPSRIGGVEKSEPNRIAAASTLRKNVDNYLKHNPSAKIFILGDFNDEPSNSSILSELDAESFLCDSIQYSNDSEVKTHNTLYNCSYFAFQEGEGTYKYRSDWNLLDQIIVSDNVITGNKINYICNSFTIFKPNFIITHSGKYEGTPFPTYGGNRYLGGYSDHFPVYAKFTSQ